MTAPRGVPGTAPPRATVRPRPAPARTAHHVFALCLRMSGSRQRAAELTQDVFVHVWERLASWRGESALGSWIYRLTVNLVLSNVRSDKRRQNHEMSDEHDEDAEGRELKAGSR